MHVYISEGRLNLTMKDRGSHKEAEVVRSGHRGLVRDLLRGHLWAQKGPGNDVIHPGDSKFGIILHHFSDIV